jgi:hypothetical protein
MLYVSLVLHQNVIVRSNYERGRGQASCLIAVAERNETKRGHSHTEELPDSSKEKENFPIQDVAPRLPFETDLHRKIS